MVAQNVAHFAQFSSAHFSLQAGVSLAEPARWRSEGEVGQYLHRNRGVYSFSVPSGDERPVHR